MLKGKRSRLGIKYYEEFSTEFWKKDSYGKYCY